jgi:hypothetical protein
MVMFRPDWVNRAVQIRQQPQGTTHRQPLAMITLARRGHLNSALPAAPA